MARKRSFCRWAIGAVAIYTVVGFLLLPLILKPVLVRQLTHRLQRDTAIRSLRINPYTLSATINGLAIHEPAGTNRFLTWERLYVNLQLSSLIHRALVLRELTLSNAFAHVELRPDGRLNFSDLISTNPASTLPAIRVGKLQLDGAQLLYEDFSRSAPFSKAVGPVNIRLQNFSTHTDSQNPYSFTGTTVGGETFAWSGAFHLDPLRSQGEFAVENSSLPEGAPYLDLFPQLELRAGRVSVRGWYQLDLTPGVPTAVISNAIVSLDGLRLGERGVTHDAITLRNLTLSNVFADAFERRVEIGDVRFTGERHHVSLRPDRSANLFHIFQIAPPPPGAPPRPPRNTLITIHKFTSTAGAASLTGLYGEQTLRWQDVLLTNIHLQTDPVQASFSSLTITNGALDYADDTSDPPARLQVQQINGRVQDFNFTPDSLIAFHLTAKVNNVAPVEISGTINPVTLQTADVKVLFDSVSLLPVDPYAGKYLGHRLTSGSVSLDLQYKIHERQLEAQNTIVLDQLNLGDATASTNALRLPFKLGLAILKDRHGVIKLDVPITGSFDNPEFKLRKVILQTLQNLFVRVLTSPFAAIGSMFGGGGEELGYQEFLPGQTVLSPAEIRKLDTLIQALRDRPALQLTIQGAFDPTADRAALRRHKLDQLLAATPLRDLYLANLTKLQATIAATNAPPPEAQPGFSNIQGVSPKGMTRPLTTAVPTARRDAAQVPPAVMEQQLLEIMTVTPADLDQLAAARATAVQDYLIQTGQIETERLTTIPLTEKPGTRVFLELR